MKKHPAPAISPISTAESGCTKPAAWVTVASPATAPETAPSALGLPLRIHSAAPQAMAPAAAANCVLTKAEVASGPAPSALPALKPNQPTHSRPAPMKQRTMLCGEIGSLG